MLTAKDWPQARYMLTKKKPVVIADGKGLGHGHVRADFAKGNDVRVHSHQAHFLGRERRSAFGRLPVVGRNLYVYVHMYLCMYM